MYDYHGMPMATMPMTAVPTMGPINSVSNTTERQPVKSNASRENTEEPEQSVEGKYFNYPVGLWNEYD